MKKKHRKKLENLEQATISLALLVRDLVRELPDSSVRADQRSTLEVILARLDHEADEDGR